MAMQLGERVPDFSLFRVDGSAVRLSELPAPVLVLVFLRHLA